jgi:late competence protein required for DNA uptake (superfamily II DNA/RNA helicase)
LPVRYLLCKRCGEKSKEIPQVYLVGKVDFYCRSCSLSFEARPVTNEFLTSLDWRHIGEKNWRASAAFPVVASRRSIFSNS